jgi:hypothetical protein
MRALPGGVRTCGVFSEGRCVLSLVLVSRVNPWPFKPFPARAHFIDIQVQFSRRGVSQGHLARAIA